MTPATEHLPVLSSLTQELKIVKRPNEASPRNDDCDDSSGPPRYEFSLFMMFLFQREEK